MSRPRARGRTGFLLLIAFLQPQTIRSFFLPQTSLKTFSTRRTQLKPHTPLSSSQTSDDVDVIIIGAGIGGLISAAVLSTTYSLKVSVYESHYLPGGCAHSFPMKSSQGTTYKFDAGPTILTGCSAPPYNPLRQVLNAIGAGDRIDWISYDSWGMRDESGSWDFKLGEKEFDGEEGPLERFGGRKGREEFERLREACEPLCAGAANIPTMALRGDDFKVLPLLKYWDALSKVIPYSTTLDGSFEGLLEEFVTEDTWLRSWIDALAFSLSGLPAAETGAAAMAYTLFDLHRLGAVLDYPRGGVGKIAEVLVDVIRENGGNVILSSPVEDITVEGGKATGIKLKKGGKVIRAKKGVICNVNCWALPELLKTCKEELNEEQADFFFQEKSLDVNITKSFLHLHLGLDITGLDTSQWKDHYTVMAKGLHNADPCADRNMVAVSNPSMLDDSLTDKENRIIVHAYGAGNEPFEPWEQCSTKEQYETKKENDSLFLWESVSRALDLSVEEIRKRAEISLVGTPLTHARFNRRYKGTYGPTFKDTLSGPCTPLPGLWLAGDSTFPGIGIPAVALSGAQAANTLVTPLEHILKLIL